MNQQSPELPGGMFLFQWTLVTAAGWLVWTAALGPALFAAFVAPLLSLPFLFTGSVPSLAIGVFQWLRLRQYVRRASLWLLMTIVGGLISWWLIQRTTEDAWHTENGMVIGAITGTCQALVLARWGWRAATWILASIAGWTTGWGVYSGSALAESVRLFWDQVLMPNVGAGYLGRALVAGVVLGAITGFTMLWLLRQPMTRLKQRPQQTTRSLEST